MEACRGLGAAGAWFLTDDGILFEAGIAEDGFAADRGGVGPVEFCGRPALESDLAEFAGEFGFERVRVDIAHGVKQLAHLLLAGADDDIPALPHRVRHPIGQGELERQFGVSLPKRRKGR